MVTSDVQPWPCSMRMAAPSECEWNTYPNVGSVVATCRQVIAGKNRIDGREEYGSLPLQEYGTPGDLQQAGVVPVNCGPFVPESFGNGRRDACIVVDV
jgi:hypothetical protein